MFPGGVTVTVRSTVTTRDDLGDGTTVVSEVAWSGCMVAPRTSDENADPSRPSLIVGKTVYGPATVSIDSDDILVIDGVEWQVDGLPGDWPWPMGGMAGLEVPVKRVSASS